MPKSPARLLVAALTISSVPVAHAQPALPAAAQPAELELTFDQALALARTHSRELLAGQTRLEQASAQVRQAWSSLFPTAAAQLKYTHNNREVGLSVPTGAAMNGMPAPTRTVVVQAQEQVDGALTVTVPVLVPWAYSSVNAAELTEKAAAANYEASEATVLLATAQSYYAVTGATEVLRARASAVDVAQRTLDNANTRLSAGTATKVDAARASLALLRAQQGVREAEHALAQAKRGLATMLQLERPFHVAPAPAVTDVPAEADQLDRAFQLRPELRALDFTIRSATSLVRSNALRWAPSISAFGNGRVFNYVGFSGDKYAWAVGAQLDWVLFDGGIRDAQRRLASAQRRESEERLAQQKDLIRDDLANGRSFLDVKRAAEKTAVQSVDLAKQTLDLVRSQYEAGTATQLDLLQAQDAVVTADVTLAQAHFDVALADLSLRRSAGLFPGKPAR